MAATAKKWRRALKRMIEGEGCIVLRFIKTKAHMKILIGLPDGNERKLFTSRTPSDYRVIKNLRSQLRKMVSCPEKEQ